MNGLKWLLVSVAALGGVHASLRGTQDAPGSIQWLEPELLKERRASGRSLLASSEEIVEGVAHIVMEDHFDSKDHYSFTLVETDDHTMYRVDVSRSDAPFQAEERVKLVPRHISDTE